MKAKSQTWQNDAAANRRHEALPRLTSPPSEPRSTSSAVQVLNEDRSRARAWQEFLFYPVCPRSPGKKKPSGAIDESVTLRQAY